MTIGNLDFNEGRWGGGRGWEDDRSTSTFSIPPNPYCSLVVSRVVPVLRTRER